MKTLCKQSHKRSYRMFAWILLLAFTELMLSVSQADETVDLPIYKPPCRGAPEVRVGGGTRGMRQSAPSIHALAPKHTGLTYRAQPDLFWHASHTTPTHYEFILISEDDIEPLINARLEGVYSAGTHRISLPDYGLSLESGKTYEWTVLQAPHEEQDYAALSASARIRRVKPNNETVAAELKDAGTEILISAYADAGLWYDSLEAAIELIESNPDNTRSQQILISLLRQVGLNDAANEIGK